LNAEPCSACNKIVRYNTPRRGNSRAKRHSALQICATRAVLPVASMGELYAHTRTHANAAHPLAHVISRNNQTPSCLPGDMNTTRSLELCEMWLNSVKNSDTVSAPARPKLRGRASLAQHNAAREIPRRPITTTCGIGEMTNRPPNFCLDSTSAINCEACIGTRTNLP
jgi:hypothetical protein